METLKGFIPEIDNGIELIGNDISTLSNVEILMGQLAKEMQGTKYRGEERVFWNPIRYTSCDLNKEYENASEAKDDLFNEVIKKDI
ncbi:hypothetical protein CN386_29065 [Bacillus cereus]|nr:hypothetical protein CN386_29065 [Bacillus cereus]